MLRLGESSRTLIVQGPPERLEIDKKIIHPVSKKQQESNSTTVHLNQQVSWGFGQDAVVEDQYDEATAPQIDVTNAYYQKDPIRALRMWMENLGFETVFQCQELELEEDRGYIASIELPLDFKLLGEGKPK